MPSLPILLTTFYQTGSEGNSPTATQTETVHSGKTRSPVGFSFLSVSLLQIFLHFLPRETIVGKTKMVNLSNKVPHSSKNDKSSNPCPVYPKLEKNCLEIQYNYNLCATSIKWIVNYNLSIV